MSDVRCGGSRTAKAAARKQQPGNRKTGTSRHGLFSQGNAFSEVKMTVLRGL